MITKVPRPFLNNFKILSQKPPENKDKWDYEYSAEKLAYTFVLSELEKQENYFKNKMKAYRDKFPEQFI
jgi:hypothetical protein